VLLGLVCALACHRRGIALGTTDEPDAGAGADAAGMGADAAPLSMPSECGPRTTVAVTGRVVVGDDVCRGETSMVIFSGGPGPSYGVSAPVPCGEPFTVQLPAGEYTLNYKLHSDLFYLDLPLQKVQVGSTPLDLGDITVAAHRVSGRFTINGQPPLPIVGAKTPCAHVVFRRLQQGGASTSYVDCQTARFTAVVPDGTFELSYTGIEWAHPTELTGPSLPGASHILDPAGRIDADRPDWVIDLHLVRVSGQIVTDPAMPVLPWRPCSRPRDQVAELWLETASPLSEGANLDVCDGKFDAWVWPTTYLTTLAVVDENDSLSPFWLDKVDLTTDVRDLRLPVKAVTWRGRLLAHGRPVELPPGPLRGLLSFSGAAIYPAAITVQGGPAASFSAILPRAQHTVASKEDLRILPATLTDELIDLTGAPAVLDRDLDLDLYRVAGRATVGGGAFPGCGDLDRISLQDARANASPLMISPLMLSCGPSGAAFQGWARPGSYRLLIQERSLRPGLAAGPVLVVDGHRDDLVIDVPAADWQRWRDEKPPLATCP
jgi:hypothetical protein